MRRALAVLAAAVVLAGGCGGDGDDAASTTTSTTVATTTTSTTADPVGDEAPDEAVWPRDAAAASTDPAQVAASFAKDFLGMPSPSLSPFSGGDSRSGEIEVRPKPGAGPTTTVFLRMLGRDDRYYVIGSASPNLRLTTPQTGATIASPVDLRGESTAFEGTIQLGVRQDGQTGEQHLGQTHTMGGANGDFAPFRASVTFSRPTAAFGTVIVWVDSAEDGALSEATVSRVRFA